MPGAALVGYFGKFLSRKRDEGTQAILKMLKNWLSLLSKIIGGSDERLPALSCNRTKEVNLPESNF